MKMVCRKANRYGGQKRTFGDEVEISRHDVRLVTVLGWFAPFVEAPKKAAPAPAAWKPQPRAAAVQPAPAPVIAAAPAPAEPPAATAAPDAPVVPAESDESKPRRQYQRRDLTAEP